MNIATKYWQNEYSSTAKENKQTNKQKTYYHQVGFISGIPSWFNINKLINMILHKNRTKDQNLMIISTDAEKAFNEFNIPSP